jgi:hypothetical protein
VFPLVRLSAEVAVTPAAVEGTSDQAPAPTTTGKGIWAPPWLYLLVIGATAALVVWQRKREAAGGADTGNAGEGVPTGSPDDGGRAVPVSDEVCPYGAARFVARQRWRTRVGRHRRLGTVVWAPTIMEACRFHAGRRGRVLNDESRQQQEGISGFGS